MDPFYHNPSPCFPNFKADHSDLISTSLSFGSSSCSATTFVHSFNLNQELESMDQDEDQHQDQVLDHDHKVQEDHQIMFSGNMYSEDQPTQIDKINSLKQVIEDDSGVDDVGKQCNSEPQPLPLPPPPPLKWMSSKMRLMKKMSSTDHHHQPATTSTAIPIPRTEHTPRTRQRSSDQDYDERSDDSPNMKIRVCSDCNTTKTPLWRSGPQGPKSLCNACGIRQRKARRAMAAAVANGGSVLSSTSYATGNKVIKEKKHACTATADHKITHYKKKCKLGNQQSKKKIDFEELKMTLSTSSAFQQVFPHDEIKEAAILLMALSCGLVQG